MSIIIDTASPTSILPQNILDLAKPKEISVIMGHQFSYRTQGLCELLVDMAGENKLASETLNVSFITNEASVGDILRRIYHILKYRGYVQYESEDLLDQPLNEVAAEVQMWLMRHEVRLTLVELFPGHSNRDDLVKAVSRLQELGRADLIMLDDPARFTPIDQLEESPHLTYQDLWKTLYQDLVSSAMENDSALVFTHATSVFYDDADDVEHPKLIFKDRQGKMVRDSGADELFRDSDHPVHVIYVTAPSGKRPVYTHWAKV